MKLNITYKNIAPDAALETFIKEKTGGLEKFLGKGKSSRFRRSVAETKERQRQGFSEPMEARVEVGLPSKHHRSGRIFYAEVNLKMGGNLLRATCQHEDLRNAIVDVKDELQSQIKKFKEKTRTRR